MARDTKIKIDRLLALVMDTVTNHSLTGWLSGGVPFHIPGNGGPACVEFLSTGQRVVETMAFTLLSVLLFIWAFRSLSPVHSIEAHVLDRSLSGLIMYSSAHLGNTQDW